MEKTVKITKSQLRRIIKEQSGDVKPRRRYRRRERGDVKRRPVGGLGAPEPEDTKNLNTFLAELRKEGATDREIVDFMIGTRMVGDSALEAMRDFKKYEMKKEKKKPSVQRHPYDGQTAAAVRRMCNMDPATQAKFGYDYPPCPPGIEAMADYDIYKHTGE
jgi:hypothetical protein